jgi:hypothetical protein
MEHTNKAPLDILRRLDSASTHSVHCVWELSTTLSCDSAVLLCVLSSWLVCVVVAATLVLVCVSILSPTLVVLVINLVRVRDSNLWRFLTKGILEKRKKIVVLKVDLWITWEGLSAIPDRRRSPQRGVAEPRVKITVSLVYLSIVIAFFLRVLT